MKDIFARYLGQKIGLNFKEVGKFHQITLIGVQEEFFSVQLSQGGPIAHPFRHVLSFTEAPQAIAISGFGVLQAPKVNFVVQMHVMSGGTIGFIFSI
jgi:hypothetical protein